MKIFEGLGVALVTPFNEDGSIDFSGLENLVTHNINGGSDYIIILGTTAENAVLSAEEKKQVINCIKKSNNKKLPLVLGIGSNNTADVVNHLKTDDTEGIDAILSVSPYYNKPTQEGIYQHYKAIAESSSKPVIIYNVPGRTGSNIEPKTTLRLAHDFKNLIAIKDACPDYLQSSYIIKDKPENFMLTSGDDELALPMTLAGGSGVISVLGQALPKLVSEMIHLGLNRKVDEAYKIHYKLHNLFKLIFAEGNPAGVKALLSIQGICKPYTRLPLIQASKELTEKIKKEFDMLS